MPNACRATYLESIASGLLFAPKQHVCACLLASVGVFFETLSKYVVRARLRLPCVRSKVR